MSEEIKNTEYLEAEQQIALIKELAEDYDWATDRTDGWFVPANPGFKGELYCLDEVATKSSVFTNFRWMFHMEGKNGWIPHVVLDGLPEFTLTNKSGETKMASNKRGNLVVIMFKKLESQP